MNKNSKIRREANRIAAKGQRSSSEKGRVVISCNDPAIARRKYASGAMVVYHNTDANGNKISITRHEAIAADAGHVVCRSKVGGRGVHQRKTVA